MTRTIGRLSGRDQKKAAEFIEELHQQGLVKKHHPQGDHRDVLAEDPAGMRRMIVVLTAAGELRLDRFNGYVNECADEFIGALPFLKATTIGYLAKRLKKHADHLIGSARQMAERRASEPIGQEPGTES